LPSARKTLRRRDGLLAIAAILEGASREEAAKIGGMDRQVTRFNEQGADGLINISSPGMPPKLNAIHTRPFSPES
jgi:transposase